MIILSVSALFNKTQEMVILRHGNLSFLSPASAGPLRREIFTAGKLEGCVQPYLNSWHIYGLSAIYFYEMLTLWM